MSDATKPDPDDRPAGGSADAPLPAADGDAVATVMRDIACPGCEYNLRGLHGLIVECPECGHRCDIVELVTAKWDKPWHKAPGFNALMAPSFWALIGFAFLVISWLVSRHGKMPMLIPPIAAVALVAGWVFLMYRAYEAMGSAQGVKLALFGHIALVCLICGVNMGFAFLLWLFAAIVDIIDIGFRKLPTLSIPLLMLLVTVVSIFLARAVQRFIAVRCIKRYLAKLGADPAADVQSPS